MNLDNLTPAQEKAIAAGGTNNAIIGGSLVRREIMEKAATSGQPFKFVLSDAGSLIADAPAEKEFAEAMEREENATPTSETWEIEQANRAEEDRKSEQIEKLRAEFADADDERREEIRIELFHLGTVVYPEGTPEHDAYREELSAALKEWAEGETKPVRDPKATRYEDIAKWTDERLDLTEDELMRRLRRRTLLGADRKLTENRLAKVQAEISARGL